MVHATPLGMFPHVNECFFDGNIPADIVFDMVYNPLETVLVKRAQRTGQDRRPGPGHVHRAGRAPVRNLDRRNRAARRHGEGRAGSAHRQRPRHRSAAEVNHEADPPQTGRRAGIAPLPLAAHSNPGPPPPRRRAICKAARDRMQANAAALAGTPVPMATEPAFQFKA